MPPNVHNNDSGKKCVFCNLSEDNAVKYGQIYEHNGIVTHYFCLLLSSNMQQRGRDEDGILGFLDEDIQKELVRGEKLHCAYCRKKGATLGCVNRKCKRTFHLPCGLKSNSLHQFFGQFKSFCPAHRPKQHIDVKVRNEAPETLICYICYDIVQRDDLYKTLWAPCCKKNAWFHRDCVQQLALSAGYFFKCPLCNNKKDFQKAMLDCGIFIPCQDASWELVPHAFEELLYRHNRCDAPQCLCPDGREHTSSNPNWELILCRTCGSQGIHMACGQLRWLSPTWDCAECSAILSKSATHNSRVIRVLRENEIPPSSINGAPAEHDDNSSDSDISLGRESQFSDALDCPSQASIVLKPGPRCAKLKQLQQQVTTVTKDSSGSSTDLDELNDILNEQQAHDCVVDAASAPKEAPPVLPSAEAQEKSVLVKEVVDDVITVDSDDDTELHTIPSNNIPINLMNPVPNTSSDSPLMNIQITEVTSLPPEAFASAPVPARTPIVVDLGQEDDRPPPSNILRNYITKRKADPPAVVSKLVNRINDFIDLPDVVDSSSKKPRIDGRNPSDLNVNGLNISTASQSAASPALSHYSVLQGAQGIPFVLKNGIRDTSLRTYHQGINMANAAIVKLPGREYVLPLDSAAPGTMANSHVDTNNTSQTNSDGDAGTSPAAEHTLQFLAREIKSTAAAATGRRGRRRNDHGAGEHAKTVQTFNEYSSSDGGPRVNRDRLMNEKVLLRDLKFRVCSGDTIKMTIRDRYAMNITTDTSRERKTVNNSPYPAQHDSKRSSQIRGFKTSQNKNNNNNNNNRRSESSSSCINDTVNLSKSERASDMRDSRLLTKDSIHFHANGDRSNLCKYECKAAAKENLVPDKLEQADSAFGSLGSIVERRSKRHRTDSDDENNIEAAQDFSEIISNDSAGTSRDGLRELSYFSVNQRHYSTSNNYSKSIRKVKLRRRKSLSSYFDQSIRCRVSIDLTRIQSFFDSGFLVKKQNLIKIQSYDDLKMSSPMTNKIGSLGSLRRCKSEGNITSLFSSKCFDNYFNGINFIDSQKYRKRKKRKLIDKHDCVR